MKISTEIEALLSAVALEELHKTVTRMYMVAMNVISYTLGFRLDFGSFIMIIHSRNSCVCVCVCVQIPLSLFHSFASKNGKTTEQLVTVFHAKRLPLFVSAANAFMHRRLIRLPFLYII